MYISPGNYYGDAMWETNGWAGSNVGAFLSDEYSMLQIVRYMQFGSLRMCGNNSLTCSFRTVLIPEDVQQ